MAISLHTLDSIRLRDFDVVPETPASVYRAADLNRVGSSVQAIANKAGCSLLYSIKACEVPGVLRVLAPYVSGFAVSSLFEARLARRILGSEGEVHLFTPALRPSEVAELTDLCDYVSLNSLGQLDRYGRQLGDGADIGLRVNPGLSYVGDQRYDPGRRHSKLGVAIDDLLAAQETGDVVLVNVSGLHVHVNCDSNDLRQLLETVVRLDASLGAMLAGLEWVNLGGGYLFDEVEDVQPLYEAVGLLQSKYGVDVFLEPGAAMVRGAGFLVSTVLDLFESDGKNVAILDTSVNHMPEVFEYQYSPEVIGHTDEGEHGYILAGLSCLAGDLFGEYRLDEPLEVGSRIVFAEAGAYTLVKAHTFNGIDLPSTYIMDEDGELALETGSTVDELVAR